MIEEKIKDPEIIIFDIDGCLTDGGFYYNEEGKFLKKFGSEDVNILKIFSKHIPRVKILFCTSDTRGYNISRKRCFDMGFESILVKGSKLKWIKENYDIDKVIYMGDEISDVPTLRECMYSICPNNAFDFVKDECNYITSRNGGNGAVAEAIIHIYSLFFKTDKGISTYELFAKRFDE